MAGPLHSAEFLALLAEAQRELDLGFAHLPEVAAMPLPADAGRVLTEAARRMHDNYPYAHPLYAGQMLKPPHPVARAAYAMAMSVNPNNHALDGGRASSAMELEAVGELAAMFGLPPQPGGFLGHLTSSGTIANLEALWIAGQLRPGQAVAASTQAHYTHARISGVLGLQFAGIPVDAKNRMDLKALERMLEGGAETTDGDEAAMHGEQGVGVRKVQIGTVVATLGTTASGAVDALDALLPLQQKYGFRIHVDGAYGGYFTLAGNLEPAARRAYDAIRHADSVVVDPHKHGLQPYGCGCVLFRDPGVGRFYKHDSPYTYFTSGGMHLGEISLECSRAGASAVALWATQRLLPLVRGGEFAFGLEKGRAAALEFYDRVQQSELFVAPLHPPQLDIVFWAVKGRTVEESSAGAQAIFEAAASLDLHLAVAHLPMSLFPQGMWPEGSSGATVLCLRSVLMKPDHLAWMDAIWARLLQAAALVRSSL